MRKTTHRIFFHIVRLETLCVIGIILFASFLRLYRISEYMTFLGDEGRDVLVAKGILEGNITLLGPRSSAADFFYGPIYYYFITPFLWLFQYDPVGPAIGIALLGILTVFLVYKFGKELFGSTAAGIFAAVLYAVSPVIIAYSRSSWNPNPLPFVSLLILYLLYKSVQSKSLKLFLVIGILLGIALQLQYLALFVATIVAVYTGIGTFFVEKKIDVRFLVKRYLTVFLGFLLGFSPFLAFEVKHGFPNIRTIIRYIFTSDLRSVTATDQPFLATVSDVLFRLFARLVTRFPPPERVNISESKDLFLWYASTILLILVSIFFIFKIKNNLSRLLFILWLVFGMGLFGFYKDRIYDYHFGFMFTLPFLLLGNALGSLFDMKNKKSVFLRMGSVGVVVFLVVFNLLGNPFRFAPNRQKEQVQQISEFVLSKTDNKPYNFALLTLGNSDHGYRYFFELHKKAPVEIENPAIDPERKSVTDQLLIVCEDVSCQPLGNSLWEVAGFGQAEIIGQWNVSVVKVYKLRHYREPMGVCAPGLTC